MAQEDSLPPERFIITHDNGTHAWGGTFATTEAAVAHVQNEINRPGKWTICRVTPMFQIDATLQWTRWDEDRERRFDESSTA